MTLLLSPKDKFGWNDYSVNITPYEEHLHDMEVINLKSTT